MSVTDAGIVARVLAGDTEAFGVLVDRYYERCVRLAIHILAQREDAEDVAQDAFLRAFRNLASYEERERFAPWLFRILVNQCRTVLAQRRRLEVPLPDWERTAGRARADSAADDGALRDELARALALLPPEQREAVVLRFTDDLTYDEMAAVTGVGVSALKMRVQRACARLRTLLEPSHV